MFCHPCRNCLQHNHANSNISYGASNMGNNHNNHGTSFNHYLNNDYYNNDYCPSVDPDDRFMGPSSPMRMRRRLGMQHRERLQRWASIPSRSSMASIRGPRVCPDGMASNKRAANRSSNTDLVFNWMASMARLCRKVWMVVNERARRTYRTWRSSRY